ncbi:uncharacterized protein [Anser cygnoides]|uniref:uncharacterized protein n=1 Tax=Anser cygnoides TaxID=8845 RepID=UPI0034D22317
MHSLSASHDLLGARVWKLGHQLHIPTGPWLFSGKHHAELIFYPVSLYMCGGAADFGHGAVCSLQATWDTSGPDRVAWLAAGPGSTSAAQSFGEMPCAETPGAPSPARSFLLCRPSPLRLPSACSQERAVEPHTLPCCGRREGRLPRLLGKERDGAAEVCSCLAWVLR